MQYITRTIRDIYPVWTESNKAQFVDTDITPTITLCEAQTEEDLPILSAPLAVDVLIPIETLQPLELKQSFFSIDSLFIQVWINGETHCFTIKCGFQPYNDTGDEIQTHQSHIIVINEESQTILGDTPLQEVIVVRINTCLTIDIANATLCVTAEPAIITPKDDEFALSDLEVTYAGTLVGFTIAQILHTTPTE